MNTPKNLNSITDDGFAEKLSKYGCPKRNLLITLLIIGILASLVILFVSRREITGITARYTAFYPANTFLYIDAQLDDASLAQINKIAHLDIKNLPDLLSRMFTDKYSYRKRHIINKLMSQSFGDDFSFGVWDDVKDNMVRERSLAVFPIKREVKIRRLYKMIVGRSTRLDDLSFKGYKITTTSNLGLAFSVIANKLFVADSYDTLTFIITNNVLDHNKGLCDKSDIRNALSLLEKNRLATVLINNPNQHLDKLSKIGIDSEVVNINSVSKLFNITAASVLLADNTVYMNSYTPYNLFSFGNKPIKQALRILLNNNTANFKPDFLPQNTISFITIKELKDYIDLMLGSSGLTQAPEYNQFKQFVKMLTSLDFENDILNSLKGNMLISAIDTKNGRPAYVAVLSNNRNTDYVMSKLVKLVPLQVHSAVISKTVYRKLNLGIISSRQALPDIIYGRISPELYVFGEKPAVESVIDVVTKSTPSLITSESYNKLALPEKENYKLLAYSNIQGLKKFGIMDRSTRTRINKIGNSVESFSLTLKTGAKALQGSLKLNFK